MKYYGITTEDNPFNPLTEFDEWYKYDLDKGYCLSERLAARVPIVRNIFGEAKQQELISQAIDDMLYLGLGAFDKNNNFVKLKKVELEVEDDDFELPTIEELNNEIKK